MSEPEDFVVCRICGRRDLQQIYGGHLKTHNMTYEEYQSEFPEAPTVSGKCRKKTSVAKIGKKNPMYGRTGKDSPTYGKVTSKETRAKIRAAAIGRIVSEKTRAKMRAAHTGSVATEETKAKMRGEKNPMKRSEVRAKVSAAWTPKKRAERGGVYDRREKLLLWQDPYRRGLYQAKCICDRTAEKPKNQGRDECTHDR